MTTTPAATEPIRMGSRDFSSRSISPIRSTMAIADPDQSGVSFSTNGSNAAWDNSSTVCWRRSHSSEFEDTATTRLPSCEATASSTVLGPGSVDSSTSLAH